MNPARVSAGDHAVVNGDGFPQGKGATLTFRGDLHRPGVAPERDVRIDASARPSGRNTLIFDVGSELERRFTGAGPRAVHTTFQGEIRVRFPSTSGETAVSGVARAARLDVLPRSGQPSDLGVQEGKRALRFLGLTAESRAEGAGLLVTEVSPEGRAAAAGIAPGDVLVELGQVTVLGESDLQVPSGASTTAVVVERRGHRLSAMTVDVKGLSPRSVTDLGVAAAVLLSACALFTLPTTRFGLVLRWLGLLPGVEAVPGGPRGKVRSPLRRLRIFAPVPLEGFGLTLLSTLVSALILGGAAWLSLGHSLFGADVDLVALPLGAGLALLGARAVAALAGGAAAFSLARVGLSLVRSALCLLPAVVSIAGAILASGRFVIAEMVADQGGAPWRWAGLRSPGLFLLMLILLLTALPEGEPAVSRGGRRSEPSGSRVTFSRVFLLLAEWAHVWVAAALVALLFLGGSRVPGVTSLAQEESRLLTALGLVALIAKIALLGFSVGALRRLAGGLTLEHVAPLAARYVLPLSLTGLVLTALFAAGLDGADTPVAADLTGTALSLLTVLVPAGMALAIARRREPVAATVNPWL